MSVLTYLVVILLALAALLVLVNLAARLLGWHGRNCPCWSCGQRNIAQARQRAIEDAARERRGCR